MAEVPGRKPILKKKIISIRTRRKTLSCGRLEIISVIIRKFHTKPNKFFINPYPVAG